jgi:methylenetetrahydrofolate reductase (NADPH)
MSKVTEVFQNKQQTFSFELFPPKTPEGYEKLLHTIDDLCKLKPDYISCTYGAGGGSRDRTLDIVKHVQNNNHVPSVHHLTCVYHSKDDMKTIVDAIQNAGIRNILALRGDPPKDQPDWQPGAHNFKYSSELVSFIRKNFNDHFSLAVAGFPEGHILCPDRQQDAKHLKQKIDAGADWIITQLFFNNQDYIDYVKRVRGLGVQKRILPGVLPITDYPALLPFCAICGATVTDEVHRIFKPIENDKEKTLKAGIDFAVRQCRELLAAGAPGIHFYCLNKVHPVDEILKSVRP